MNWGLALSGGAACGLANIGVIEALEAVTLRPNCVGGSSMGAIVAGLYALGHTPRKIQQVANQMTPVGVVELSAAPFRGGLHGGLFSQRLEDHLYHLIGDARIGDCEIPFTCIAGKVLEPIRWERALLPGFTEHVTERVQAHTFGPEVPVFDAIRASSAIPIIFSPGKVGVDEFVDLLHFGPIPARSLRQQHAPDIVIATDTQPLWEHLEPWLPPPVKEFMQAGQAETALSLATCDLVIRPPLPATALRFDQAAAFAKSGLDQTRRQLPEIRALLEPEPLN